MTKIEEETVKKMAVSYHRVSPTKIDRVSAEGLKLSHAEVQDNLHRSLVSSIEMCDAAAKRDGCVIEKVYTDEYVSGKNQDNMIQFKQMMQDAREGKISKIYIRKVSRFGRNLRQSLESLVELDKIGINIVAVENGIDSSKAFGKSLMTLFIEFAEQERETLEEARRIGIDKAKANGVVFGQPKKDINVEMLRSERLKPVGKRSTWKRLENDLGVSRSTMISRLKSEGYWNYQTQSVM